jgi:hypothetical protein
VPLKVSLVGAAKTQVVGRLLCKYVINTFSLNGNEEQQLIMRESRKERLLLYREVVSNSEGHMRVLHFSLNVDGILTCEDYAPCGSS